eukprot:TRINITY_DN3475_c0_g1_i1.p1 TRINITY_DN3475_c0_g1~~TRINITY_DN3475_c0_g1_i1.p1  ORF type:complete len:711 (-),score=121.41 TRINITY_DN3475_c0_g1_i1:853-2985(-)
MSVKGLQLLPCNVWKLFAWVVVVGVVVVDSKECLNGCRDRLAEDSILSCNRLQSMSGCQGSWMEKFCTCSCGFCEESEIEDTEVVQKVESEDEPPCECSDTLPVGSSLSCSEYKESDQCSVMRSYGFCECACGKCKDATNIIYILPQSDDDEEVATSSIFQNIQVESEEDGEEDIVIEAEDEDTEDEDEDIEEEEEEEDEEADKKEESVCPTDCEDVQPDEQYTCAEQKRLGKCARRWMEGFCQCSCGTCPSLKNSNRQQQDEVLQVEIETALQVKTDYTTSTSTPSSSDTDFEICKQSCNENPPPKSSLSCPQQAALGKCARAWMTGFCECTCETCDILQQGGQLLEQKSISMYIAERSEAATVYVEDLPVDPPKPTPYVNSGANIQINLLHFNDLHARLQPTTEWWWECEVDRNQKGECFGGLARMKTIVDQVRAENKPMLLLNGGDDFVGTSWDYNDRTNKATARFLSKLGVDAMALGNHEFDHGPDNLIAHIEQADYPVLSCNMDASQKPRLQQITQKYVIKNLAGLKVGIFGLTTTYTNYAEAANPYPVWFTDGFQAAEKCAKELKQKGAQVVIALSHNGYNFDKHLAKKIGDLDIVVGAHSHTFLARPGYKQGPVLNVGKGNRDSSQGDYPTMVWSEAQQGKQIPVVQAGWASRYIGKLAVEFDGSGKLIQAWGQPILLGGSKSENNVPEDADFVRELESWKWW